MEQKLQKYYEDQFDLFGMQGWKDLISDCKDLREVLDNVLTVKDSNDLYIRKGQLDMIDWLINWEESVDNAHKELANEQ